jgi:hypothetical protein
VSECRASVEKGNAHPIIDDRASKRNKENYGSDDPFYSHVALSMLVIFISWFAPPDALSFKTMAALHIRDNATLRLRQNPLRPCALPARANN